MAEHDSDLYEQQLFVVFESCLANGENELNEEGLFSICSKLHLDGLIEELKSCISKQRSDKQSISFSEFRDGLLLLLKKSQGLISDKQHIVQSYYNLNTTCNVDIEKKESLIDSISKVHSRDTKTVVIMDKNRLIRLWESIKVYLKGNADPTTMRFMSSCLGVPELPKQITESIFERLDQNCDGLISFDEFVVIFQKTSTESLRKNNESYNGVVNCNVNTLEFSTSHEISSLEMSETLDKEEVAGVSNVILLSSSGDLNALDDSLAELTSIICDELKNLNESLDNDTIQSHISLLREIVATHQDEQRNLYAMIENMRAEKEKMRTDVLEANERANALAQEVDEYQVQLDKTKENLQRQNEQRYVEITKELSNQFYIEREMDAAALKSKDDQLQVLQKENHDMKNKVVNMLQENQMLETENKILLGQIDKLRQSNNNLLAQIKVLDAEHDEIQDMETKQQEQVNFFVERIKQLQSEVTLLRDQNDELGVELENFKRYGDEDTRSEALPSLAYDLQINEKYRDEKAVQESEVDVQVHATMRFDGASSMNEQQFDVPVCNLTAEYEKLMRHTIMKDLENLLLTNTKCVPEKCALKDGISKLIVNLRSNAVPRYSAQDCGKNIASELDTEFEERTNESLRDLVISKVPKLACAKRATTMSNSMEDISQLSSQDAKTLTQNKVTSLRDYPPRKEEHSMELCKAYKEKDNLSNIAENVEHVAKVVPTNTELLEIEKKQLIERCQELERSLDLLKVEYEECEDYWAAKLEEERQLFEQEQKISDDKLAELINKIAEYEELISPSDKLKNNGRLSPIEEKFNLEQQYVDLEEEFEKWKIRAENDISQKNLEIVDLREKLRLAHPVTSDSCIQVSDEVFSSPSSDLFHCKSPSTSSIPSTNDSLANMYPHTANVNHTLEFPLCNNPNGLLKQDRIDDCNPYMHSECSVKRMKNINKSKKKQMHKKNPHISGKTILTMKEEDQRDAEFKLIYDVMKETNYSRAHSNAQQHIDCIDLNIVQDLKIRLYAQERKKRQLQRYIKQQRQYIERLLQRVMVQHQTEVCELQCLLRNTQERLQMQVQMTVDQADKLANADILVKDLYMENAYLTAHVNRLEERFLVFTGLNVGRTSM